MPPFDAPFSPADVRSAQRSPSEPRGNWSRAEIEALFDLPFSELVFQAATIHRAVFDPAEIQLSQLLSIKTGGCAEDCGYCSQSSKFDTGLKATRLMDVDAVIAAAAAAKRNGAGRFCMGAAWRDLKDRDLPRLEAMISGVKALGLETCATLGMLKPGQAQALRAAGLDYYNHNLDTAPEDYGRVVSTRTYEDRLDTLEQVRAAGMSVCCGGIVGMGETRSHRAGLIQALANLAVQPESVPINALVPIAGTPIGDAVLAQGEIDGLEFVRTVAVARIACPRSVVRIAAGREAMSHETQALAFLAGANSMFVGGRLLTTPLPGEDEDTAMLSTLGMKAAQVPARM